MKSQTINLIISSIITFLIIIGWSYLREVGNLTNFETTALQFLTLLIFMVYNIGIYIIEIHSLLTEKKEKKK